MRAFSTNLTAAMAVAALLVACRPATGVDTGEAAMAETDPPAPAQTEEQRWADKRLRMVSQSIASRDVTDERVLEAMRTVPRHRFVPASQLDRAYNDHPLPIGHDQTISQPYIVALMSQYLRLDGSETVLEIGTGSGYQAAVLGELAATVHTLEIVEPLCASSTALLAELGHANVHVHCGDGYEGWPEAAPFHAIMVTAAPDHVPQPLVDQLAPGGIMVLPVGPAGWSQELTLIEKAEDGSVTTRSVAAVAFVPMTGEAERR